MFHPEPRACLADRPVWSSQHAYKMLARSGPGRVGHRARMPRSSSGHLQKVCRTVSTSGRRQPQNLVAPSPFDPRREISHFRISGPDNACTVLIPQLCRQYGVGYHAQFEFLPSQTSISELVERGQLDLILQIDDGLLPVHFHSERLDREDWVCVVARDSHVGDRLSLEQYLAASHIVVATYGGVQTIPYPRSTGTAILPPRPQPWQH